MQLKNWVIKGENFLQPRRELGKFYFILFYSRAKSIPFCSILLRPILGGILFFSVMFCSVPYYFYYVIFCAVLFYSVMWCDVLFCSILLCYILCCSILLWSILCYSILLYSVLLYSERRVGAHAVFDCDITPSFIAVQSRKWDNNFSLPHRTAAVTLMHERLSSTQACLCLFIARPRIRKIW